MDGGLLHKGDEKLFDALVYEAKTGVLIQAGWLSPIRARAVSEHADLESVHIRMGDFKNDEMIAAMDHSEITEAAVKDVLDHAADRKSILVFAAGVEHAKHIEQAFRRVGQTSITTVTQETSMYDRDEATKTFKAKTLRILVNVGVYTTGFDAPNVDCIVLLRATKSPGLYVQMLGRGLRKTEGKTDCLLLDYGNNIETHGPLDMITADSKPKGEGEPVVKTCPGCATIVSAGFKACPHCGFIFPREERDAPKHGTRASDRDPVSAAVIRTLDIRDVDYARHQGHNGKPDSMVVSYYTNIYERVREWVCVEHEGFARQKAAMWFARRGILVPPKTVDEAIDAAQRALWPAKITVRKDGKYDTILSYSDWKEPEPVEEKETSSEVPF
jgi:DNA repair protein RadD